MKRYDITIKAQLKKAGIELIKYSGKSHSRISHEGIEVSQENGHILIDARGLYTKTQILESIDCEVEITIYNAKEESKEVEPVEKSTIAITPKQQQVIISKVKEDGIIGEIKIDGLWYDPIKKDYRVSCGDIECPNNSHIYSCKKCIFEYGDSYYLKHLIINRGL